MESRFHDSYDIQAPKNPIPAPEIIEDRFSHDSRYQGWTFRDSNFSWSYHQNSLQAISFLSHDPRYIDKDIYAIASLNLHAIGQIIDMLGGVKFQDQIITSKNIFSILEDDAKSFNPSSEEDWLQRKGSIKPLANTIIKKIIFSPHKWKIINNALINQFALQNILATSTNTKLKNFFTHKQWNGTTFIEEDTIPYGINFSSIGGKKSDRYMTRNITSTFP